MTKNACAQRPHGVRKSGFVQAGALVVFLFVSSLAAHAQQLTQLWANRVDGPAHSTDELNAVTADSNDNSYVTGEVCVTTTATGFCNGTTAMLTIKYDKAGNVVWQDQVTTPGTSSPTAGSAIAVDAAGNVYVAGSGDSGQAIPNSTPTARELLTIKYSPTGQRLWMATHVVALVNGPQYVSASGIAVDSSGNSYIAGKLSQNPIAIIKYDPNGNQLWEDEFSAISFGAPQNGASQIAVDSQGSLYIAGTASQPSISLGDNHGFTAKFDSNGNTLWTDTSPSGSEAAFSASGIVLDSSGNAYVTGTAASSLNSALYSGDFRTEPVQEFVTKYDPSGNHVWVALYQTPRGATNVPAAITLDASGNVYTNRPKRGASEFVRQ